MAVAPTSVTPTATIKLNTVSFTYTITNGPSKPRDYVGIFRIGDDNTKQLDWKYLANNRQSPRPVTGVTSGTVNLTLTNPTLGAYQIRFNTLDISLNIFVTLATSDPIMLGPFPTGVTLIAPPGVTTNPDNTWEMNVPDGTHIKLKPTP